MCNSLKRSKVGPGGPRGQFSPGKILGERRHRDCSFYQCQRSAKSTLGSPEHRSKKFAAGSAKNLFPERSRFLRAQAPRAERLPDVVVKVVICASHSTDMYRADGIGDIRPRRSAATS